MADEHRDLWGALGLAVTTVAGIIFPKVRSMDKRMAEIQDENVDLRTRINRMEQQAESNERRIAEAEDTTHKLIDLRARFDALDNRIDRGFERLFQQMERMGHRGKEGP